jgi:hypothetical protein
VGEGSTYLEILGVVRRRGQLSYVHIEWRQGGFIIAFTPNLLRAADRYAYICCGSTACSVGTVYGGKGHLYTPGVRPALLATPCLASLATPCRLIGNALSSDRRRPARPVNDALLG